MKTLAQLDFAFPTREIVNAGFNAAAVLDVEGHLLAVAGAFNEAMMRAVASVVTGRMRTSELLARMLDGELIAAYIRQREFIIGIAAECVFVAVETGAPAHASRVATNAFRDAIARMIRLARADLSGTIVPPSGSGSSSSGPAELPVIEWGVTVRRKPPT